MALAKEGNIDEFDKISATLHWTKDVFLDDQDHPCSVIDTPYLTTRTAEEAPSNEGQHKFRQIVDHFMSTNQKNLSAAEPVWIW